MTVIKKECQNCVNASLFLSLQDGKYFCALHENHVDPKHTCEAFEIGEQVKLKNRPIER